MSMAGRKEVPHFLLYIYTPLPAYGKRKCFLLVVSSHLGPTALSAYIVNRQENNTRSADTWDVATRAVFFLFGIVETEQGLNWAVAHLAQAFISYVYHMTSPICFCPFRKWLAQLFCFLQNNQRRPTCFSIPVGPEIFQDEEGAFCPENGL